jgi:hypothetical protein
VVHNRFKADYNLINSEHIQIILIASHGIRKSFLLLVAQALTGVTAASAVSDAHVHGDVPFGGRCATVQLQSSEYQIGHFAG